MRLYIQSTDRFIYPPFTYYGLAHGTAFLCTLSYVQLLYPDLQYLPYGIMLVSLALARLYKIIVKGVNGGFSCLAPAMLSPLIIPPIFHFAGYPQTNCEALVLLDYASIAVPFYMILVRLGNILNGEIVGRPLIDADSSKQPDGRWAISYYNHAGPRLPVQLYEALVGAGLLVYHLVNPPYLNINPPGNNYFWSFVVLYVVRFIVEFFKDNRANTSLVFYGLNQEQYAVLVSATVFGLYYNYLIWWFVRK